VPARPFLLPLNVSECRFFGLRAGFLAGLIMIRIQYVSVKEAGEEIDSASGEALDQAHPFVAG
jgi:hypothetical protein